MGKVRYNQSGYCGSSMSVRAMEAYEAGEKPKSKWTKKVMLAAIKETLWYYDKDTEENMALFSKFKKDELFNEFFEWSSWHHTGKFANETDFYDVNEEKVIDFLNDIAA